jgi:SAM-dependent methyltransferase
MVMLYNNSKSGLIHGAHEKMTDISKKVLNAQQEQWEETFTEPEAFGESPSYAGQKSTEALKSRGVIKLLELGAGQGRDTFLFARNGLDVTVGDYSVRGIEAIRRKAHELNLADSIHGEFVDVRMSLPFEDETFDACYSHMLFCMALTITELDHLSREIRRVLKPNGVCIYTARNTSDPHFGTGIHRGEEMYEVNGYIVQFYDMAKVQRLSAGFNILSIEEFKEGGLPRNLYLVTMEKKD